MRLFTRKSPATLALHEWVSDLRRVTTTGFAANGLGSLNARLPGILARNPDLERKFKGDRPLAWCMATTPRSQVFLDAMLAYPPEQPGALDPCKPIQDVIDVARNQLHTEHVVRALARVLMWSKSVPNPALAKNANLIPTLVSMHPEVDHLLLEKLRLGGLDPNARSPRGYTALHMAVANNANGAALAWSIRHCNLDALDHKTRTALALAVEAGAATIATRLLDAGADPRHPSVSIAMSGNGPGTFGQSLSSLRMQGLVHAHASHAGLKETTSSPEQQDVKRAAPRL